MSESLRPEPDESSDTVGELLDRARIAGAAGAMRTDIIVSWRRSAGAGLRPEILEVPFHEDVDARGRLACAAGPIIARIGEDLGGSGIGLLLTDERGLVIDRQTPDHSTVVLLDRIHLAPGFGYGETMVGTNAIGTALERSEPTVVQGEDHFADDLTCMACAAATVTDPRTGRLLGVVDLSCPVDAVNALMLPLAKRAAWEIEQRLLDDGDSSERMLRERFWAAKRTTRMALIGISRRSLLANAAATRLVSGVDRHVWWERVRESLADRSGTCVLPLPGGATVTCRCRAVVDGADVVGALLSVASTGRERVNAKQPVVSNRSGWGWESLTDAEIAVAAQVATGMTNREVAARLFVSPHTIDFHLRQLFRKLDVRSRVELTRAVLDHQRIPDD